MMVIFKLQCFWLRIQVSRQTNAYRIGFPKNGTCRGTSWYKNNSLSCCPFVPGLSYRYPELPIWLKIENLYWKLVWSTICKCFSHVTKTCPNFTTYTRKPGNNNGTFIFDIDTIKKSYPVNLKFKSLPLSKPKWQFFSGAVSWCSQ